MIKATIIADSTSEYGKRIVTVECQYPRFIHGEVMTHRVFSRNAMSSRAIPVAKMIEQVRTNPAMPVHWGANQSGMQASQELSESQQMEARQTWMRAARAAADCAEHMAAVGLHKQVANRLLEPFQWMRTIITSTEWDNFFELRCHPDAQPEFQVLACSIRDAMAAGESTSVQRRSPGFSGGVPLEGSELNWHLPYVKDSERALLPHGTLIKLSAARCARVSYLTHDGENPDVIKDLELFDRLVGSRPLHASPIEHQATPTGPAYSSNNFRGWVQFREIYEGGVA